MKIRNGFVSNSSSSSFIINLKSYNNSTLKLAKKMIPNSYNKKLFSENLKNIKNIKANLLFGTTNYDTYITYLDENYALVETCNNENWDYLDIVYLKDLKKYHIEHEDGEYRFEDGYETKPKYISLFNSKICGHKTEFFSYCDKCYNDFLKIGNFVVCPNCGCDENGKPLKILLREEKIKRIRDEKTE